jgi:hypothetical protein
MASLTRVIGINRSAPEDFAFATSTERSRAHVIGNAIHDLDRDLQAFPQYVDALDDALPERVVDMQNNRRLWLHAGGRAELLDAGDGIRNQRGSGREIPENLGKALLRDLRRGCDIDQERNFAGLRRLSDRYGAPRIVGADQERAAVTDQALGDNSAVLGLGFGIAIQEFHRRTAGLLDDFGAELVSFAGLLTHEGLDAAEIENDSDFRWGALRSADAGQNGCSKCSCAGSYNPAAGDGLAFTHAELPLRAMPWARCLGREHLRWPL